ncbi:helix-turn-helix domain-containing protein [Robbsia andropogonis]|uniref:helix-turn-helix domain-containing protein n=1 Tax=Robbsia andropogonis TaxID=28092 RepID=UPI002A6A6750|nr:helix-turn-helix domain-containing protein [Robbsia andropogonis]
MTIMSSASHRAREPRTRAPAMAWAADAARVQPAANVPDVERVAAVHASDSARIMRHVSADPNIQADAISGWTQQYDQLSTGPFSGSLTEWQSNGFHFFSETTSQALRQACRVRSGAIWFGIPDRRLTSFDGKDRHLPAPGTMVPVEEGAEDLGCICAKIRARSIDVDMVACQQGDRDFELVTPSRFRIFGIVITESAWREVMHEMHDCPDVPGGIRDDLVRFELTALDALREVMYRVLCAEHSFGVAERLSPFQAAHFQDEVLRLLASGLRQAGDVAPIPAMPKPHRRWIVDTARQYVLDNRERPIGIPELCTALRASRRTLQYCFQGIYGMSPQRYLRATRLNGVRRALLSEAVKVSSTLPLGAFSKGDEAGLSRSSVMSERRTVQEIAAEWGFWHHSQFTADYRQLFGMTPSETQRRGGV